MLKEFAAVQEAENAYTADLYFKGSVVFKKHYFNVIKMKIKTLHLILSLMKTVFLDF